MKKICLIIGVIILWGTELIFCQNDLSMQYSYGSTAYPYPVEYQQPDGTVVEIQLFGDRAVNWAQTIQDYKLIKRPDGGYYYAINDPQKGMIASSVLAHGENYISSKEKAFREHLDKNISYSRLYIEGARNAYRKSTLKWGTTDKSFPTYGKRKLVAVLVEYKDVKFTKTKEDFQRLFNEKDYHENGATGSVYDFFYDNSFGKMELNVDVAGPYTLSENREFYGGAEGDSHDKNPRAMAKEGVTLADRDLNFSDFDNNEDGVVDGIYIIFAGYGEEAGASSDAVWSHAWNFGSAPLLVDNIEARSYSCSPELLGNRGEAMTSIGVICHEFLHVCGLPDYYDTDYDGSGGQSFDLGKWDIMAGGSWNNRGKTPPFVNAYSRQILGWQEAKVLDEPCGVAMPNAAENNVAYKMQSSSEDEFFVMENRQKIKWDEYLPSHGMLIYHVDLNKWSGNQINVDPNHQGFDLEEADGVNTEGSVNGDPFPGSSMVTDFNDNTTASSTLWSGEELNKPISNIREDEKTGTIFFDFRGGKLPGVNNFRVLELYPQNVSLGWDNSNDDEVVVAMGSNPFVKDYVSLSSLEESLGQDASVVYQGTLDETQVDLSDGSFCYFTFWVKDGQEYRYLDYLFVKPQKSSVVTLPYKESFDQKQSMENWGLYNISGVGWQTWKWGTHYKGFTESGNYFFFDSEGYGPTGDHTAVLQSPVFDITGVQTDKLIVSFDQIYRHYSNSQIEFFSSTDNGKSWTSWQKWQASTGVSNEPDNVWFDVSSLLGNDNICFKWVFTGGDSYYWMVDNLTLSSEEPETPEEPDIPTGIESVHVNNLKVYPVPCHRFVNIEVKEPSNGNLFDSSGRKILDFKMDTSPYRLNVGGINGGVYYIRVENSNGVVVRRVVVL